MFAFDVVDRLTLPACKKYSCCLDLIMFHFNITLNHSGCNLDILTLINKKKTEKWFSYSLELVWISSVSVKWGL